MDAFEGIIHESGKHYRDLFRRIEKRLKALPLGSVKVRKIKGTVYYYLQKRVGDRVIHTYLGKEKPEMLIKQISERRALKAELKKVKVGLKLVGRVQGRRRA